jgi:hypothetical protein
MDYNKIAKVLIKERCDKHKIQAKVINKSDSIQLLCCCKYFEDKLLKLMEKEMKRQNKVPGKELLLEVAFQQ